MDFDKTWWPVLLAILFGWTLAGTSGIATAQSENSVSPPAILEADNQEADGQTVEAITSRPEWAVAGERHSGDLTYCVLESEAHLSSAGAKKELMHLIRIYLREQAEVLTPEFHANDERNFSDAYIVNQLIPNGHLVVLPIENEITVDASNTLGKPQLGYVAIAEVQLGPNFRRDVLGIIRDSQLRGRVGLFGLGYLGVLSTLGIAVIYLKIDAATRHHYSRRLLMFAFVVWIAISAISWLIFSRMTST